VRSTFRLRLLSASALAVGIACVASSAPAVSVPKPKLKVAKLEVDVAGYVETRRLIDTTSDCHPGVTYVQTNTFDFETGRYVGTKLRNISVPGTDGVIASKFSKSAGSATVAGSYSGYRTTNWCAPHPPDPEPLPPRCVRNRGEIAVSLQEGGVPGNEELTGLGGKRLMLAIKRKGSGSDDPTCPGTGAGFVNGVDGDRSVVGTSFMPGVSEIVASGLQAVKVFNLGRRERLRRAIVIDGPCRAVTGRTSQPPGPTPNPGALNADGDCWLVGKIVLSVRSAR
jgi:hypothetical protein